MPGPGAMDAVSLLAEVPYFGGLPEKTLKAIASQGKIMSYDTDSTIVGEGGAGLGFYLILDGRVEVRKGSKVIATLGRGEFFGEMSLIDGQPRSADVVATSTTECWVLVAWSFDGLLKAHPEIALPMLKELVKRLRTTLGTPAT